MFFVGIHTMLEVRDKRIPINLTLSFERVTSHEKRLDPLESIWRRNLYPRVHSAIMKRIFTYLSLSFSYGIKFNMYETPLAHPTVSHKHFVSHQGQTFYFGSLVALFNKLIVQLVSMGQIYFLTGSSPRHPLFLHTISFE